MFKKKKEKKQEIRCLILNQVCVFAIALLLLYTKTRGQREALIIASGNPLIN